MTKCYEIKCIFDSGCLYAPPTPHVKQPTHLTSTKQITYKDNGFIAWEYKLNPLLGSGFFHSKDVGLHSAELWWVAVDRFERAIL